MSSIANPQPELPADEELVAYLDGELSPDDCRRVEARLAADADYRRQLHDLDQAWEALDALPAPRIDDDFARTTMELVTIAAEGDLSQRAARAATRMQWRKWWLAGAGIAAAVIGFAAARGLQSRGDRALLADLPVIRQFDQLTHVENIDFLRRLSSAVPLDRLTTNEAAIQEELLNVAWLNAPRLEDRQMWIEALTPEQKAEIAALANRFRALSNRDRNRLRDLQREIREAEDAEQLQRNLLAYGQWLARLSLGEQEELKEALRGRPVDEQLQRLQRFVRKENAEASRQLSNEDEEKLRRAVLAFVDERRSMLLNEMRRRGAGERARRLEEPRGALMILNWTMQNEDAAIEARDRIVGELSPEARAHLDRLGPRARRLQLWQWIRDSLQPKWSPGELEQFFANELDNNQRERLLDLPPGEMQSELERLYLANEIGIRGMMEWRDGPRHPQGQVRPDFRPGMRGRPGGPPLEYFERGRFDGRPEGPEPPEVRRRGERPDRRPPNRPGPPPQGI
jgi:hypothetical protein